MAQSLSKLCCLGSLSGDLCLSSSLIHCLLFGRQTARTGGLDFADTCSLSMFPARFDMFPAVHGRTNSSLQEGVWCVIVPNYLLSSVPMALVKNEPSVKTSANCCVVFTYASPFKSTRWVLETWRVCGLRPLMTILITASISSKINQSSTIAGFWCVRWDIIKWIPVWIRMFFGLSWRHLAGRTRGSKTSITVSQVSKQVILPFSNLFQRCHFSFCAAVHEIGTKVWLTKKHNTLPDVDLESFDYPAKSASWNEPNLHSHALLSNMTVASVVAIMLNITDSSGWSLVACSVPFRHVACQSNSQSIKIVRSADASQIQAVRHDVRVNLRQFSDCFPIHCFWIGGNPSMVWILCVIHLLFLFANSQYGSTFFVHDPAWCHVVLGIIFEILNCACSGWYQLVE